MEEQSVLTDTRKIWTKHHAKTTATGRSQSVDPEAINLEQPRDYNTTSYWNRSAEPRGHVRRPDFARNLSQCHGATLQPASTTSLIFLGLCLSWLRHFQANLQAAATFLCLVSFAFASLKCSYFDRSTVVLWLWRYIWYTVTSFLFFVILFFFITVVKHLEPEARLVRVQAFVSLFFSFF